jgi:hypothetical protein
VKFSIFDRFSKYTLETVLQAFLQEKTVANGRVLMSQSQDEVSNKSEKFKQK